MDSKRFLLLHFEWKVRYMDSDLVLNPWYIYYIIYTNINIFLKLPTPALPNGFAYVTRRCLLYRTFQTHFGPVGVKNNDGVTTNEVKLFSSLRILLQLWDLLSTFRLDLMASYYVIAGAGALARVTLAVLLNSMIFRLPRRRLGSRSPTQLFLALSSMGGFEGHSFLVVLSNFKKAVFPYNIGDGICQLPIPMIFFFLRQLILGEAFISLR